MTQQEPVIGQQSGGIEKLKNNSIPKRKGGARPGAGRKKGGQNKKTIERLAIQQAFVDRIHSHADQLLNAALRKAMGESYLIRKVTERDAKGKVTRVYHETVRDEATILQYFDEGMPNDFGDDDEYYYISTKPVDMTAVKELYDRAFGKSVQREELTGKDGAALIPEYTPEQAEQLLRLRAKRAAANQ